MHKTILTTLLWGICLTLLGATLGPRADERPPIRFGLQAAQQQTTIDELREVWLEAEALGFDTLWVNDHLLPSIGSPDAPELEAWTLLAAMATLTSRIRIGCLVTNNTFRQPAVLAKMAATVDHLSNGRLIFGIGAGWFAREHEAYGIPFYTEKGRAARLAEALAEITALWSADPTVSYQGRHYALRDAPFSPKPLQKPYPPILIGGVGEKLTLPLVARYAQMWNVPFQTPDVIAAKSAILEAYCREIGRDCRTIERSYLTPLYMNTGPEEMTPILTRLSKARGVSKAQAKRMLLAGSPAEVRAQLQAYIDVGVTHFIINLRRPGLYDREGIRTFARKVMPHFRHSVKDVSPR